MSSGAQPLMARITSQIAQHIGADEKQVTAAVGLLDGGATVPFISRYRKEATGGLSDSQLRDLDERLSYLRELEDRRSSIIEAIEQQGKLDDNLRRAIDSVSTKAELEDLYLPYKKKRRTKGQIAIEAGLQGLAEKLWQEPEHDPLLSAAAFVTAGDASLDASVRVADEKAALEGARFILMERFAEDAALIARLRLLLQDSAHLCASVVKNKQVDGEKFKDYFDHQEPLHKVPGHRALAMFRGRSEGVLSLQLLLKQGDQYSDNPCVALVGSHVGFVHQGLPADDWRSQVVTWTWKIKLSTHLESELFSALRERADAEAIGVFASNLNDLLLAAPAGQRSTLGLDPGYRSGVKVVVVDATGKVLDHTTVYPHKPQQQWQQALETLCALCKRYKVELVAVGNGTASRETEKLAQEIIDRLSATPDSSKLPISKVVVSEAGASVYSASKIAETEFPELDVTIRGAVSIARRLQDPLAELVKIDPKAIGVGQYQHDVSQTALARSLDATVEDCVNAVGVDLGTASAALLARVAGLSAQLANNIVAYRDENGVFKTRSELKKVPRLGPKAFEQAAGFLRIRNGKNPLDNSAVHPESYPVVKRIVSQADCSLEALIGDSSRLQALRPEQFVDERVGLPTVKDIFEELEKPGRDPRPEFKTASFTDGVESISDLLPDQILEGQVTNVTAFGAFVDVGVHQDGLVHISALSDSFVKDPRSVVKTGDIVKVKVMEVDIQRKRIALSMRLTDSADERSVRDKKPVPRQTSKPEKRSVQKKAVSDQSGTESALALSLKAALDGRK